MGSTKHELRGKWIRKILRKRINLDEPGEKCRKQAMSCAKFAVVLEVKNKISIEKLEYRL
jgi:hypothetical protein